MSLLSLLLLMGHEAAACGGFACSALQPVLQNAERVVFGLDPEANEVEMHVQITYTGPSEDFSWIVPVPANPDLFLTSSALFQRLALATQPVFTLVQGSNGRCGNGFHLGTRLESYEQAPDPSGGLLPPPNGGVSVVGESAVGPYETVTLQAESADGLLAWLEDNGYDIPANFEAVLAPYVAQDAFFVALKLSKNNDAGDLAPLALRYSARKAMVPVQLTSVSATPDMRMEAYVLSDTRAVPESYLHVRINDAAIDWWSQGSNYSDVITQAANEAGGHAFATDYYGDSDLVNPIWFEEGYDRDGLRRSGDHIEWMARLVPAFPILTPELFVAIEDLLGLPAGQGIVAWSCPDCVTPTVPFAAARATVALEERVIEPLRTAQELLSRHPKLSRMTSSLDAFEMTVDPTFVLNPDLRDEPVSLLHSAKLTTECHGGQRIDRAERSLMLEDGRKIALPSEQWMREHDLVDFEYIGELGDRKAQIIEQMGESGQPEILADYTEELFDQVRRFNGPSRGCGCDDSAGAASLAGLLVLLLGVAARRELGGGPGARLEVHKKGPPTR